MNQVDIELIERSSLIPTENPPVLFVHGAWHGAWCWEEHFLDYFAAKGFTSLALSLRGHGNSGGRERLRFTRLADYVEDVNRVVNSLPRPPVLVGHSMGGYVVKKYLQFGQAHAAVLMSAVPPGGPWGLSLRMLQRYPALTLKCYLSFSLKPFVSNRELVRSSFFSENIPDDRLRRYASMLQDESFLAYLDMLFLDRGLRPRAGLPMMVLGAENDQLFTREEVEATASAYGTKARIIPGIAHDMMLDDKWAEVADSIIGWIEETMQPGIKSPDTHLHCDASLSSPHL